ncbi:MAG: hypothetical protein QHH27_06590 [Clostridia bacterium]|nr:hypothetical protein [Clostridia bacterium]MDH7573201.1 hypothetical protein [Clostridia bacterium]
MRRLFNGILVLVLAVSSFALGGCGTGGKPPVEASPAPLQQASEQVAGADGGLAEPRPGTLQAAVRGTTREKPDVETFVHRFMRYRLLEPFGERVYAMLTERGKQAFVNGSDPTLGGAPVRQRLSGYRLEEIVEGQGSWTATLTIWLTGPAEQAESMFYREKLTIVRQGEGLAVDGWEPGSPTQAYAARGWTALDIRDAAGREKTVITSGQIPVPFTPQGDNPEQKVTSAGEFKCVALFPDGRAAFAVLGLFGFTVGVAAEGEKVRVLDRFEHWVGELVWAPGGRLLAVEAQVPSGRTDILIYDVTAGRRVCSLSEALKEKEVNLTRGCWLADDRYFYFFSTSGNGPPKLWELDMESGKAGPAQLDREQAG